MQRFIAPSASPNATATRRSPRGRPRSCGRQIATRISAAKREPPERRARRPELVEQLDRERRADLQRRDREQDEPDGRGTRAQARLAGASSLR